MVVSGQSREVLGGSTGSSWVAMVLDSLASSSTLSSASVFPAVTVFHRVLASCGRCGFCADCLARTATAFTLSFGVTSGCPDSFPVSWLRQDGVPASCGTCGFCADCLARQLKYSHFLLESLPVARIASPCHGYGSVKPVELL